MCRGGRLKLVSTTLGKPNHSSTITSINFTLGQDELHPISTRPGPHPLTICHLLLLECSPALTIKPWFITHPFPFRDHRNMIIDHQTKLAVKISNHCDTPKDRPPLKSSNISPNCSSVSLRFQRNDLRNIKTRNTDRSV